MKTNVGQIKLKDNAALFRKTWEAVGLEAAGMALSDDLHKALKEPPLTLWPEPSRRRAPISLR
jgi:hypothetical protein